MILSNTSGLKFIDKVLRRFCKQAIQDIKDFPNFENLEFYGKYPNFKNSQIPLPTKFRAPVLTDPSKSTFPKNWTDTWQIGQQDSESFKMYFNAMEI